MLTFLANPRTLTLATTLLMSLGTFPTTTAADEAHEVPSSEGMLLKLHHRLPTEPSSRRQTVLHIHGATFPSGVASGYRLEGRSWIDDLAARGLDVWALDFAGYGESDRYPAMTQPASKTPSLLRAAEAADQIASAVHFITKHQGVAQVSLIAHSWGTVPAALFASLHPEKVNSLVLFGPIAPKKLPQSAKASESKIAFHDINLDHQWKSFQNGLPEGVPSQMNRRDYKVWGAAYLNTDEGSSSREPQSVRVPFGPMADYLAAQAGELPYDPENIQAATLVVRGEWDAVTSAEDLQWLYQKLTSASERRLVTLDRGTHRMHLEASRQSLFDEIGSFLEREKPPQNGSAAPKVIRD